LMSEDAAEYAEEREREREKERWEKKQAMVGSSGVGLTLN